MLLLYGSLLVIVSAAGALQNALAADERRIILVDKPFKCGDYPQPVDFDLVKVTMTQATEAADENAVKLTRGCTGRIGRVEVDTYVSDGIKIGSEASDLVVEGGYVRCWDREGTVHQDGIQAMGGSRIMLRNLDVHCPTANNAALFINQGLGAETPPTDIVCDGCRFLSRNVFTLRIYRSVRSGARNSLVCGTIRISDAAVDPIDVNNRVVGQDACGGPPPPPLPEPAPPDPEPAPPQPAPPDDGSPPLPQTPPEAPPADSGSAHAGDNSAHPAHQSLGSQPPYHARPAALGHTPGQLVTRLRPTTKPKTYRQRPRMAFRGRALAHSRLGRPRPLR